MMLKLISVDKFPQKKLSQKQNNMLNTIFHRKTVLTLK